jgi:dihydrofolate reductase
MSRVFVHMGMSLDGFIAGPNRGPKNPMGGAAPAIHGWAFQQRFFRQHLELGDGGETGLDNQIVERIFERIGANVMGKRMFDEGEACWPENAPFRCPVFVLTHEVRRPWERPNGTTFYFVNDGLQSALSKAREAAGNKDVRISGGGDVVRQYLNAGLVDELSIALTPVFVGDGIRLFDGIDPQKVSLELAEAIHSPVVTHLRYNIER